MERYNYIAPARVKVLVVPINQCNPHQFIHHYQALRTCHEVTLLDITPMTQLKHFNPQTSPQGRIIYDFDMTDPDNESIFLHDFEPHRKTFIVLGIGEYQPHMDMMTCNDITNTLTKQYPSTIVQNCIIFNTPVDKIHQFNPANDHTMKSSFFHHPHGTTLLETIMCEISRNFLYKLDDYADSYANITLRSPVSITDSQLLSKTISKAQKRISSGSSSLKVSFNGNNHLSSTELKSNTQVKHNGRQSKLIASFYLLSGKYIEALNNFTDAILYLRKSEDYMWLGSALEGIGVVVVLLNYTGITYQLPSAILSSVLQLLKSKLRDMTIDNTVIKRLSSESLSRVPSNGTNVSHNGHSNGNSEPRNSNSNASKMVSPRTSSSSGGLNFNLPMGTTPDLNTIAIPELIKHINHKVNAYFQLSINDFENTVPDLVYIESILRYLQFMLHVYKNGSNINRQFFETLVNSQPPQSDTVNNPWINKLDILTELDKIYSLQLVDLNLINQCRIYGKLATIYHELKMFRKQAFLLRTLLVAILPEFDLHQNQSVVDELTHHFDSGSIKDIINEMFKIYQINKQPESNSNDSFENTASNWNSMQLSLIKLSIKIFENLKDFKSLVSIFCLSLTRYTHCLPADDELKIRGQLLTIARTYNVSIPYWDPFLLRDVTFINPKFQDELIPFSEYSGFEIGEATPSATPSQTPLINNTPFFDPYNKPVSKTIDKEKLVIQNEVYQLKIKLQNPYNFEIEINDIEIVSNLKVQTVKVGIKNNSVPRSSSRLTISNPKIRVPEKNGTPIMNSEFTNLGNQLMVGAKSIDTFIVPFKPLESGDLEITGCKITVGFCESRVFPIINHEFNNTLIKLKDVAKYEGKQDPKIGDGFGDDKPLTSIIDNLSNNHISNRVNLLKIELNVLPPQPSLSLINLLVNNGWLMLLEGEKYEFSISLINQSNQPINYLSFSFWDSTIQSLNKKLNSSNLGVNINAFEIYELEWYLHKFKSFKILNKREINDSYKPINANDEIKIKYEITGKRNMTDLKMILEYGNKLNVLSKCFIKNIEIPLKVTVVPSLELINFDIMPLFLSSFSGPIKDDNIKNLSNLKTFISEIEHDAISDYCLIIIDIRNSWTQDLIINIDFNVNSKIFTINETLQSKKVSRFLLPMKRIHSGDYDLTKVIPSLRNKQYIKDYLITEQEDIDMRTNFWLRDIILNKLQGSWQGPDRHGQIDFRNIRLTSKMVNYLMYPKIKITHEIIQEDNQQVLQRHDSQFLLKTGVFYSIKTIIKNFSHHEINGILRHLPFPVINNTMIKETLAIDKKILINGTLQNKLAQPILPDEVVASTVSFVILENGEFEWGSLLDVFDGDGSYRITGREPVYIASA